MDILYKLTIYHQLTFSNGNIKGCTSDRRYINDQPEVLRFKKKCRTKREATIWINRMKIDCT